MMLGEVYIIAEAGVNHNGSMDTARQLIDVAKASGANAVKFQTFDPTALVSKFAEMADYQKKNTNKTESQLEMISKLALDKEQHIELIQYSKNQDIELISSPFDIKSIDLLQSLNLKILKIPSGEVTNLPFIRHLLKYKWDKVIASTGMCNLDEVGELIKLLQDGGINSKQLTVLHCNTEYPTPLSDVNLNAMLTISEKFNVQVGYSDHTLGINVPIAAVALGAMVIEKHFTLDKNMSGPDHIASLNPEELKNMVSAIRDIEKAKGSFDKKPSESEKKNIQVARKSIVASRDILKGEPYTLENITTKRPGHGLNPMMWDSVLGQKAKKDLQIDELIEL